MIKDYFSSFDICRQDNKYTQAIAWKKSQIEILNNSDCAIIEPMGVFSTPLQKRAVKLIVEHNHPGGLLRTSPADRSIAGELNQPAPDAIRGLGRELKVPVIDHLIITKT